MKGICIGLIGLTGFCSINAQGDLDAAKLKVIEFLDTQSEDYGALAHEIWNLAELGFQETESTALLQNKLKSEGFRLETGVAGMPTAFIASWGEGQPVIGILAEFDALAGMAQEAVPYRQEKEGPAGHACGHHLFGAGSSAAAIAVKNWMQANRIRGTVRLYGTPAEEGGGGKVYMVRAGLFNDVDAVLHWHPGARNAANPRTTLAAVSINFKFYGVSAHAAGGPWRGRSALDGVEAMNYMANLMREHVTPETRIHYAITQGAKVPANIVPDYAESQYIIRHPDMKELKSLIARILKTAEAAALGTETRMEYEIITGYYNILPNIPLAEAMYNNLERVGGVVYTAEERAFALKIMESFPDEKVTPDSAATVQAFSRSTAFQGGGSSDVGDISWVTPTAGLSAATWTPGTVAHSWQAVAAGGTTIGRKGMMVAAKTIALTAMDLFTRPELLLEAKKELQTRTGTDFKYEALLGDREPPLDYTRK